MEKELMNEVNAIVREPKRIKLSNGKEIEIKPLVWKQELQIFKRIGEIINIISKELNINIEEEIENELSGDNLQFIGLLLEYAPEKITEIANIITGVDKNEIENEWHFEDIVEVVLPFLGNILNKLKIAIGKVLIQTQNQK